MTTHQINPATLTHYEQQLRRYLYAHPLRGRIAASMRYGRRFTRG